MSKINKKIKLLNIHKFMEVPLDKKRINNASFIICKPHEYYFINKFNYNITQLKEINKAYNIRDYIRKYEPEKYKNVYRKLEWRKVIFEYLQKITFINKIKSTYKMHLVKRYKKLLLTDNFKNCTNDTDFYTLNNLSDIPHYQFIGFTNKKGFTYGFDIISLLELVKSSKNTDILNPYNREIIPREFICQVKNKMSLCKILGYPITNNIHNSLDYFNEQQLQQQKIISIFHFIDEAGYYTNSDWFKNLDKNLLIKFILDLYDIWSYRLQLTDDIKNKICTIYNGNPFHNIPTFLNIETKSFSEIREIAMNIIVNMTQFSISNEFTFNGCAYCLMALTLVSSDAANALPVLFNSVV